MGRARCYFSLRRRAVCSSFGEPQRGERAGGALDELLQRAAWAGGENFKHRLGAQASENRLRVVARAPRHTAPFPLPEHIDQAV
jgi:hypothetical protein